MSNILLLPYNWFHQHEPDTAGISGGEVYLSRLCTYLQQQGHIIRAIVGSENQYTHNGIECMPQGSPHQMFITNTEHYEWADIMVTQLLGTPLGYNIAFRHKKPLIFIAHNNSTGYPTKHSPPEMLHVIYNSYNLRNELFNTFGQYDSIVVHPVIKQPNERISPTLKRGRKPAQQHPQAKTVTLINCSLNKGGHVLVELAKLLPNVQFLGVLGGYQDQVVHEGLTNLRYLPNGTDMGAVYTQTKILIAPSQFESYSQACAEALTYGIPVIANKTPGIEENLSYAGIFISRGDIQGYANKIIYLIENESAYNLASKLSKQRADFCAHGSAGEMVKLNEWISKIKAW